MPLPEDFASECLYRPDAWFVHDLIELDRDGDRVVARVDTTRLGPLVDAQRVWPGHDKHFPGAIAIQITGTLGQLHAAYLAGLRATDGWFGFGTHIKKARFPRMGIIGPPVTTTLTCTRRRNFRGTWFFDYDFQYEQEGAVIYESTQTAAWGRSEHRGPLGD
ncbi:MAG: hypothetical protein H6742_19165 [Alphaproteobacteria bacterium]|nr:hypothetical protein [Alphaproteobacteria bacterium]